MGRRVITTTLALSFCLLAARAASAEPIVFQNPVVSGNGQSGPTQGVSGSTAQQVQTVDLGDVTGTVCDCGEIKPATSDVPGAAPGKGGFPKFPLLAAAVAPSIPCLLGIGICTSNPPTPTPTPPTSSTPEPVTITTFLTGLTALAGLRLRRRRT